MKGDSICWDCQRAVCGCSWAKKLKPVEGWIAEENKLGYRVLECPLFIEDYKWVGVPDIARLLQVNERTLYRLISGNLGIKYSKLKLLLARAGYELKVYKGKKCSMYIRKRRKCHDIR